MLVLVNSKYENVESNLVPSQNLIVIRTILGYIKSF